MCCCLWNWWLNGSLSPSMVCSVLSPCVPVQEWAQHHLMSLRSNRATAFLRNTPGEIVIYCYSFHWEKDFTKQNNPCLNWMMFVNNIIRNWMVNPLWFSNDRKSYNLNTVCWGISAWERHWTMVGWNVLQEFVEMKSTGRIWWRTSLLTLIWDCPVSGLWDNI